VRQLLIERTERDVYALLSKAAVMTLVQLDLSIRFVGGGGGEEENHSYLARFRRHGTTANFSINKVTTLWLFGRM